MFFCILMWSHYCVSQLVITLTSTFSLIIYSSATL
uniref:Uncharacterized protein n=1 Tax=Arundo donax TaxID=35708 RepID=A0A0A9BF28_ARUDO